MRLLLDTAVLIYAVEAPERLSKNAAAMIRDPENTLELSAVSLVEIAIKSSVGKLRLDSEAVRRAIEELGVRVLPFTAPAAFALFNLPLLHRDPFDRQIISQALMEDIPVLTSDQAFKRYKGLRVIW
jgi:PIN domain nuclease of toxin-antitoxin system